MKIQITEELIATISTRVAAAASLAIREVANLEEEKELIASLLASTLSRKERIVAYLHHTRLGVTMSSTHRRVIVFSEDLRRQLNLSVYAMAEVREQLRREGHIGVQRKSPLRIMYQEPLATPA